jgi:predicted glycoside hydrolase/deacetylase ChbG (UPF0249 family)
MGIKEITKEELKKYNYYLTVGDLKKFLDKHNIPDNSPVLIQRVENVYYEKHHWGVYLKEGEHTFKDNEGNLVRESLEQYHPAWGCVKYEGEDDILFIDLHY